MPITEDLIEFYDLMLDGEGLTKMIRVGGRKGVSPEKIRIAARMVYDRYFEGEDMTPLNIAHKVFKVAKHETIKAKHHAEVVAARERNDLVRRIEELERKTMSFWAKLLLWWPSDIYFL